MFNTVHPNWMSIDIFTPSQLRKKAAALGLSERARFGAEQPFAMQLINKCDSSDSHTRLKPRCRRSYALRSTHSADFDVVSYLSGITWTVEGRNVTCEVVAPSLRTLLPFQADAISVKANPFSSFININWSEIVRCLRVLQLLWCAYSTHSRLTFVH